MPRPSRRSRTLRRVKVRTPGGDVTMHYRKRKPASAVCKECGKELHGVPRERPYIMRGLAKTEKRPERIFGGVLCGACTRIELKSRARL